MKVQTFGEKLNNVNYINRQGVYGISFNSKKQVALIKVPYGYFLPGGGIENDENHERCLKREYREETGFNIDILQYVDCLSQYTYSPQTKRYLKLVGYFYIVDLKERVCDNIEEDHELVWRDIIDIKDIMNLEYQYWIIRKLYNSLKFS